MSTWFDQSNNANKLRQSYLKGFLDISGGAVNIRADNSLNFYTADEDSVSKVAIDASEFHVMGKRYESDTSEIMTDVSRQKIAFLKDLSDNVQFQLDKHENTLKYVASDSSGNDDTLIRLLGKDQVGFTDASTNNQIELNGHLVPSEAFQWDIGSSEKPFRSLYLENNTIFFKVEDTTVGTKGDFTSFSFNDVTGQLDLSFNGKVGSTVLSYDDQVAIGYDPSNNVPQANLDLSGTSQFQGNMYVKSGDISLNNNLVVGKSSTLKSTLTVSNAATLSSTLAVTGASTMGSTLTVSDAATLSSTLDVTGASTMGSTLDVTGASTMGSTLTVSEAATLSSTLDVTGASTMGSTLTVSKAATLSSTLDVTGASTMGSTLTVSKEPPYLPH